MTSCHPWLTCGDIRTDVHLSNHVLGQGAVKTVIRGQWKNHKVAVSQMKNASFTDDFNSNLETLLSFHTKDDTDFLKNVVQLIGFCDNILVTEYHFFGSAEKLDFVLQEHLPHLDPLATKFSLCVDFVSILHKLHTHRDGPRVLCDANTPDKALSQFLLSDGLKLLLNDMDALPVLNENNNFSIKCGHRELGGEFVAPEQMWPFEDKPFDDSLMPGYDEKVDVWKVPDVCLTLIGKTPGANKLLINLFNIHAQCKNEVAKSRPSAGEILYVYESVWKKLNVNLKGKTQREHSHDML